MPLKVTDDSRSIFLKIEKSLSKESGQLDKLNEGEEISEDEEITDM